MVEGFAATGVHLGVGLFSVDGTGLLNMAGLSCGVWRLRMFSM